MNASNSTALACALLLGCSHLGPDLPGPGAPPSESAATSRSPLEVVDARMAAYNRHDLEAFLAQYANDIRIYTYPDTSLGEGKAHLRSIFEPMFAAGDLRVEVHHQIEKDRYVVNHETVYGGDVATEYVSIYEVDGGLIRSVRFVRD